MTELNKEETPKNILQPQPYFITPIYTIEKPEFLEMVNVVSEERLAETKKEKQLNEIYPVYMTNSYFDDPRVADFSKFIGESAWAVLNHQGYDMEKFNVQFMEMWTQEHYKHSAMEQHTHGYGAQIVGFYFLEVPEDSSYVCFHDPRPAKKQISLPEKDGRIVTESSDKIFFKAKPGLLMFANSWLEHSFTRHASDEPMKFVHFNLTATIRPGVSFEPKHDAPKDLSNEPEIV